MASINHLEMCDQLKALPEIEIKKTCFGLFTQAVYKPSQSVIKVNQNEYSVEVGGQLEKLLNGGNNTIMEQRNKGKKYSKSDMGNMRLDTCFALSTSATNLLPTWWFTKERRQKPLPNFSIKSE